MLGPPSSRCLGLHALLRRLWWDGRVFVKLSIRLGCPAAEVAASASCWS